MVSPNDDFQRKASIWWSRNTEKYPELAQQYGKSVPLDAEGKLAPEIVIAVQEARRLAPLRQRQAATPLVGEGPLVTGQERIQPPEPVDWRAVGRDVVSGLTSIPTMPLNLIPGVDFQQMGEKSASALFGVEPRDFEIPEDAGLLRTILDPVMPALGGINTISERFLDPFAAMAWQSGLLGADPYGQDSARQALRQAGYGPMESITGAYEQADIPWYYRVPVEIATSPEELIPGVGIYAGAAQMLGRRMGKVAAKELTEQAAKRAPTPTAPTPPAPTTPLVPMDQPAGPTLPLPQPRIEPTQLGLRPVREPEPVQARFGEVDVTPPGGPVGIEEPWQMTKTQFEDSPDVVFHGSAAPWKIQAENLALAEGTTGNPTSRLGAFFSTKQEAERIVDTFHRPDGVVQAAQVTFDNPYKMPFNEFDDILGRTVDRVQQTIGTPAALARTQQKIDRLKADLISRGHDGIIIGRPGVSRQQEFVAFYDNQIKRHEDLVSERIAEGRFVPDEVLRDYPNLVPATELRQLGEAPIPLTEPLALDVPVSQLDIIPDVQTARQQIDDIISKVPETSPNKSDARKLQAQGLVRTRFDDLGTGRLNLAQSRNAAKYISLHTGVDSDEIARLASQAKGEETFGIRGVAEDIVPIEEGAQTVFGQATRFGQDIVDRHINPLVLMRQERKHTLKGFKSHYGRLVNQALEDTGMARPELESYLDEISQGQLPGIGDIPVQEVPGTPNRFVWQLEMPIQPVNSKTRAAEASMAQAKNEGFPLPADDPSLRTSALGRNYKYELAEDMDSMESALRNILPADLDRAAEARSPEWLTDQLGRQLIVRYEGAINSHLARIQDFVIEGARKMQALGLGERVRGLAYGTERTFRLTEADWGTLANPGPMMILYRALHREVVGMPRARIVKGMSEQELEAAELVNQAVRAESRRIWVSGNNMAHPAMAPGKAGQREQMLDDLLRTTDFEEDMRFDFDPTMGKVDDYFDRGFKPARDAEGREVTPSLQQLMANPGYTKSRSMAEFVEQMDAGLEPMFRDPHQQSAWSQHNGIKFRLQTELAHWLQSDKIGLGVHVESDEVLNALNTRHDGITWRIPRVGPAFEGKGFEVVEVAGPGEVVGQLRTVTTDVLALDKTQKAVFKAGQIAVPSGVADKLESIFRGGATTMQKTYSQKIPLTNKTKTIDVVKLIDAMVFIPKRLKLFASLFQVTDFMRRVGVGGTHGVIDAVWSGVERGMTKGQAFDAGRVAGEARQSMRGAVEGWWGIVRSYGAAGRTDHYRVLLRSKDTTGVNAVMEGTDISWDGLVRNGLNVRDLTILPSEDMAQMVDRIASEASFPLRVGRYIKELEYSSRRGLFDRVYPAAIMTDVKYNLVPMAKRLYPNATDEQIMGLVARQANLKYSTLLRSQSNVSQFWREFLTRTMFSLNENEGLLRQLFRAVNGDEKAFWAKYWLSAGVFFGLTATLIHAATTAVTDGSPKPLPKERFVPWRDDRPGWWKYGYNNRFLSPDIPLGTRSGERAMVDMLGQLDTAGRMFDFQAIPGDSFINARKGATAGAFMHLISGKDFYGRETDKFGFSGKLLQFAYDIAAPIGFGEAGIGAIRKAAGDIDLPPAGAFIAPEAKLKDILPVDEATLGMKGMLFEATGENIKAPSTTDLERKMILNVYPEETAKSRWDLDYDKQQKVESHEGNQYIIDELRTRTREGAVRDRIFDERKTEIYEIKSERMQAEHDLSDEYDEAVKDGSWEPSRWKRAKSDIQLEYRVRMDMVFQKYADDADVKRRERDNDLSDEEAAELRKTHPLRWARHRYFKLVEERSGAFKRMDYKEFNNAVKAEQSTWGDELVERWDATRAIDSREDHAPKVAQYYQDMNTLENALGQASDGAAIGWFNTPEVKRQLALPTTSDEVRTAWADWLQAGPMERRRISQSRRGTSVRYFEGLRTQERNQMIMLPEIGPVIDRIVIEWYNRNPVHVANLEFYYNLYKGIPKRMRSVSY